MRVQVKKFILILLSFIFISTVQAQTVSAPIQGTFVRATIAYSALTNSYTNILVNTRKLAGCTLTNATDAAISWDNSSVTISESQPAYSKEFYDFGSNGRYVSTTIRIKYTALAPTAGNVYINCYY